MKKVGLLCLLATFPAWAQSEISGMAHVIDGSTVQVTTQHEAIKVRLGIAVPENPQSGASKATAFLEQYAEGEPIRCVLDGTRFQNLEDGICYVAGQDVGAALIRAGLARDCPAFSGGRYWPIERPEAQKLSLPDYCMGGSDAMDKQARMPSPPRSAHRR
jgi:endonuclease YncB( thermonuclease family)